MWPPTRTPSRIKEGVKEWVPIAQAIITIVAVFVGGWWSYKLFIEQREQYPHANLELKLSHVALSERVNLLRVGIELTNVGKSLIEIEKSIIRVQQILPSLPCPKDDACAAKEIDAAIKKVERQEDQFSWLLIAERENSFDPPYAVEPGGEKQTLDFEFVAPSEVKVVRVYAYFRNEKRSKEGKEIGWDSSSYYDFHALAVGGTR